MKHQLEKPSLEEHIVKLVEKEGQKALPAKVLEQVVRGIIGNLQN